MQKNNDNEANSRRLRLLADELIAVASRLEAENRTEGAAEDLRPAPAESDSAVRIAQWVYRLRRFREAVFSDISLFGEPAWDMLLDLFIAEQTGRELQVSSVCIAAAVPPSTALRWIGVLEQKGLIRREHDRADGRRILVRLSPAGRARMSDYFARIEPSSLIDAFADQATLRDG